MCTVTFWPHRTGFVLGMNRDESLGRAAGLPPEVHAWEGRYAIHPSEPSGGSWVSVNDAGTALALINWYAVPERIVGTRVSRGAVPQALRGCAGSDEARARLHSLPLSRIAPFRLIGVFPETSTVLEWRWNGTELTEETHPWAPRQWASSGFDEPSAQIARKAAFDAAAADGDGGSTRWLRRLHASHGPQPGPLSTCMHRHGSATVSYTEIEVNRESAAMRYALGPLCSAPRWFTASVPRRLEDGIRRTAPPAARADLNPMAAWGAAA